MQISQLVLFMTPEHALIHRNAIQKTRVAVRAEIIQWIEDKVELECVLWLYGPQEL